MTKTFVVKDFRRNRVVKWLPEGTVLPDGSRITKEAGEPLTVKDLCDGDGNPIESQLKHYDVAPEKAYWITAESMGAPYSGTDGMAMLSALADFYEQDVNSLLAELVLSDLAQWQYNVSLREARPKTDKQVDRSMEVLFVTFGPRIQGFDSMSTQQKLAAIATVIGK